MIKAFNDLGLKQAGIKLITTQDLVVDSELPNMGDIPLGVVDFRHLHDLRRPARPTRPSSTPGRKPMARARFPISSPPIPGTAWR
jgi:hypothetical protein